VAAEERHHRRHIASGRTPGRAMGILREGPASGICCKVGGAAHAFTSSSCVVARSGPLHLGTNRNSANLLRAHRPRYPPALAMPRYLRASAGRLRDIARGFGPH
jgi:hypothetical protein